MGTLKTGAHSLASIKDSLPPDFTSEHPIHASFAGHLAFFVLKCLQKFFPLKSWKTSLLYLLHPRGPLSSTGSSWLFSSSNILSPLLAFIKLFLSSFPAHLSGHSFTFLVEFFASILPFNAGVLYGLNAAFSFSHFAHSWLLICLLKALSIIDKSIVPVLNTQLSPVGTSTSAIQILNV